MKNHVPTIETCQKLMQAGFPQETHYWWYRGVGSQWFLGDTTEAMNNKMDISQQTWSHYEMCAAPILTEILEQLPLSREEFDEMEMGWQTDPEDKSVWAYCKYTLRYPRPEMARTKVWGKNHAEAAAKLWLELHREV